MVGEEEHARRKKAFFEELYSLDNEDDHVDEAMAATSSFIRSHLKSKPRSCNESPRHAKHPPNVKILHRPLEATSDMPKAQQRRHVSKQPLRLISRKLEIHATPATKLIRSVTAPVPSSEQRSGPEVTVIEDTPVPRPPHQMPAKLRHTVSSPSGLLLPSSEGMPPSGVPKALGKRKRAGSIPLVAEHQRIFKDLVFYFFPNNDVDKARRARIQKSIQYGATWAKDWREGITHAIIDANLEFRDLCKYTGLSTIPVGLFDSGKGGYLQLQGTIAVVNEKYPADCITHRCILDAKQLVYKVPGYEKTAKESDTAAQSEASSQTSLPLKPAKGDVVVREPQTPSRTDEGSNELLNTGTNGLRVHSDSQGAGGPRGAISTAEDPLRDLIEQARAVKHLPLDPDDDEVEPPSANVQPESDDDRERGMSKANQSLVNPPWQKNFHCMEKHDPASASGNPNAKTIEILQEMANYYDRVQDSWRTMAYRKAIATLRKQSGKIATKEEAMALPFVGARLAVKIEEIVITNRLRRLDTARLEPSDKILQMFVNIYGVGYQQASKWVSQGYKTLADLLANASLSGNQRIGIAHYDDFITRIPRAEVAQHGAIVRHLLRSIDPAFQVIVGGSYRRGASETGDIDLIITKPNAEMQYIRTIMVETVIPQLFKQNFLRASLGEFSNDTSQWHGASCLPGSTVWRRIDLLLVPWDEMGGALIYYTGNDIFNRSIRLLASKKGMRLNQRGLYKDVIRGKKRERVTEGTLVEGRSEKRIFEILGVPWRPPEHRNC